MSNEDMLKYCQSRIKVYTMHKLNLKGVSDKAAFDECVKNLIEDINDDSDMLLEIETSGNAVPKLISQAFASLGAYSDNVMQYYCRFKELMNL